MMPVQHGYQFSVYLRIARFALGEKGVPHARVEINPFDSPIPETYLKLHPFGRVPALVHGEVTLFETAAITRYVDEVFAGPALQPDSALLRARMVQVQSVVDSYAYWPLVRQVFSHAVFRPRTGAAADADQIRQGLEAAPRVLHALAGLATGGRFLLGDAITLADIHLAPILAGFAGLPAGRALLEGEPVLAQWWARMEVHPGFVAIDPGLPG